MEHHQTVQTRAFHTAAVVQRYLPALRAGNQAPADLQSQAEALNTHAQERDDAIVHLKQASQEESDGFEVLRKLVLNLPKAVEGELDKEIPAEAALLALLGPVYSIAPITTNAAELRGQKLKSALDPINEYLSAQRPKRPPITSAGQGLPELLAALAAQPALVQAVADWTVTVSTLRSTLKEQAGAIDRLNKRFYKKLKAEARGDASLSAALGQIGANGASLPRALAIRSIKQGGINGLQLLLHYAEGTASDTTKRAVEWMVGGIDTRFVNSMEAGIESDAIGPFIAGQTVKVRTRITNGNGTRIGSVRVMRVD